MAIYRTNDEIELPPATLASLLAAEIECQVYEEQVYPALKRLRIDAMTPAGFPELKGLERYLSDVLHSGTATECVVARTAMGELRAAIAADRAKQAAGDEPVAHMWQHGETGITGFVEHASPEELAQWERMNRPRKIVAPLYTRPTPAPETRDVLLQAIQRLNQNPYSLTKRECIHVLEELRSELSPAPETREGANPWPARWWWNAEISLLRDLAQSASHPTPETREGLFGDHGDDLVTVPRGLLGAACAAIRTKRDAPETVAQLRRYIVGDLSTSPAPTQDAEQAAMWRWLEKNAKEVLLDPRRAASEICPDMRTKWEMPTLICSGPVGGHVTFRGAIRNAMRAEAGAATTEENQHG